MGNSAGSSCTEITYFHIGSLKAQNSIYDHKKTRGRWELPKNNESKTQEAKVEISLTSNTHT